MQCARCKKPIDDRNAEYCVYCDGPLCYDCWDEYGECGHREAWLTEAIGVIWLGTLTFEQAHEMAKERLGIK